MNISQVLELTPRLKLYILSPHLDDAAWSLAIPLHELASKGHMVEVVTIFSETNDIAIRKQEDRRVLAKLHCQAVHLDLEDAILDGRPLQSVFDETYKPNATMVAQIVDRLKLIMPEGSLVLAPSGFGVHVDHLTTRTVAERLKGYYRIIYYEDLPYAARDVRLNNARAFFSALRLTRQDIHTSPAMIAEHIKLYNLYASQRQDHHISQIENYLGKHGFGLWL